MTWGQELLFAGSTLRVGQLDGRPEPRDEVGAQTQIRHFEKKNDHFLCMTAEYNVNMAMLSVLYFLTFDTFCAVTATNRRRFFNTKTFISILWQPNCSVSVHFQVST
jgi:hypothetical protein